MLQLSSLTKGFGGRVLFDRVTWQISAGDRVGLCGPNGSGKTTLLRMLAGFDEADSGTMAKRTGLTVGYLPQDGLSHTGRSLIDEVSTAFQPLLDIQRAMQDLEHRLADPRYSRGDHDAILERLQRELQHRFRDEDGLRHRSEGRRRPERTRFRPGRLREAHRHVLRRLADAHRPRQADPPPAARAAARRAHEPSRPRGPQLARGLSRGLSARPRARVPRPLLPRPGGDPDRRDRPAHADAVRRDLLGVPGGKGCADRGAARARRSGRTRRSPASSTSSTSSGTRRPRPRRSRAG